MNTPRQKSGGWQKSEHPERMPDDLYPTPAPATECLLRNIHFNGTVWECASGLGHISEVLERAKYDVISTDLCASEYEYGEVQDFLASAETKAPNIVTNPPYILLREFLHKSVTLPGVETVTFFMPMPTLSKVYMQKFFTEFGMPALILAMVPLFKIYMGKGRGTCLSLFTHCWVHWDLRQAKRTSSEFRSVDWRVI